MTPAAPPPRPAVIDATAQHADRMLHDTRYDGLRSRGRRRALVIGAATSIALVAVACLNDNAILVVATLLPAWSLWWVLQRVVRGMADLPDPYVDERVRSVRNAHYRTAYVLLCGLILPILIALYISADARLIQWRPDARHLHALFWLVQLTALMLPSMLMAWNEREV